MGLGLLQNQVMLAGVGGYTNLEGVLEHFVKEDPSGNHKYLMWMIKTYLNEESTAPFEITSLVKRFHKNVDRLSPANYL